MYFDLADKSKENRDEVALIRVEQLYPLPVKQLEALQQKYNRNLVLGTGRTLEYGGGFIPENEPE